MFDKLMWITYGFWAEIDRAILRGLQDYSVQLQRMFKIKED